MEELVGRWWHEVLVRVTAPPHVSSAVHLSDMQHAIGVMFRAAGGTHSLRVAPASARRVGGPHGWLHRLAGGAERATLGVLEPQVMGLPPTLAVFANAALNRDLYLWLALLSAHFEFSGHWIVDNQHATQRALHAFPGFAKGYHALCDAHLAQRPALEGLSGRAALAEQAVQVALRGGALPSEDWTPQDVAPVWLWMVVDSRAAAMCAPYARTPRLQRPEAPTNTPRGVTRRHTQIMPDDGERNALVLPFRGEALMSWAEMVRVNRSTDDEADGNAERAANDMDRLSVVRGDGQTLAARVKFDLDLPSSSADDLPIGPGQAFAEWDYQRGVLVPGHCMVQERLVRQTPVFVPSGQLRRTARQLRRRLEVLRDAPRAQRAQPHGEGIDLDAWVRLQADHRSGTAWRTDTPAIYTRTMRAERSLATLLLADLSQSTDAHATETERVIDVIRDALYVFGEALHAAGDPFSMWGFSSVRRQHVRLQRLKRFEERWDEVILGRVGAIRPGYYTRMGAALRHATVQLGLRPERKRLLILLTDGKPNDLDKYEGRYGLEDTRHAIHEARVAGLVPFCVTIDTTANDYLPMLFGRSGYCLVGRPQDLVLRLTQVWTTLAR